MKKHNSRLKRMAVMTGVIVIIMIGAVKNLGTGSISSFGFSEIAAICPLGALETIAASQSISMKIMIPLIIVGLITIFAGRVFCGWICPVPLTRKLMVNRLDDKNNDSVDKPKSMESVKSALAVCGLTLGSAAVFGFPVFCLICPIGLILGTLFALIRLFGFNEPAWDIVVFPMIIAFEIVFFRHWCSRFCPLGALLGLLSRLNRNFRPVIDKQKCSEVADGTACGVCRKVCPYGIDLRSGKADVAAKCTKCKECSDNCPKHAIKFPWR